MTKITSPERLREIKAAYERRQAAYERRVLVCGGAGCVSCHCQAVRDALEEAVEALGLGGRVRVMVTGCIGICAVGPVMVVEPDGVLYTSLDPERAALIARRHLLEGEIVEECTFYDHDQKRRIPHLRDIGFFREQVRIALRNCGQMEYASLEAYIARDGYAALAGALTQKPADVVEEIKRSGLRGRGGAGFPTGVKWEAGMNAAEGRKYMVCNADEGDPGAFMDRSILEGDPHSLIEGMLLGGYAIGASRGYVYVRAEYPLAVERLSNAIHQAREAGLLGEGILGSDFDFDLEIRIGAGAFVCGEETALMNSVEGRRGEPDQKPPFPFESGLFPLSHHHQQRRNPRQRPRHPLPRRGLVPRLRHGEEPRHQGLCPLGQDQQHGPCRGAHGHPPGRDPLHHRRRHPRRQGLQGHPVRRPQRRVPHPRAPQHPRRLREPGQTRRDHGIGRPHRHGRGHLHGRYRPLLHGLHPG